MTTHKTITALFWTLFLLAVIVVGIFGTRLSTSILNASTDAIVTIGKTVVVVNIADTPIERNKGLSRKKELPENEGLFFVFEKEGFHGFWMPEMKIAIDIIWIDKEFKIVDIKEHVTPDSFPEVFTPKRKVLYALEVNAGFVEKYNIVEGSKVGIVLE